MTAPLASATVIRNPVLKGFNPDPSILRVGDDFYLATSTFEWFPGVQIHHSRDLVNWRLLTRPLDRASQLDMTGNPDSGGIWAPCLSYSDGVFYLIYTDVKYWKREPYKIAYNYLVTARAIEGPWSEPVFLNSSGFDPSLFHDDDGRKWYLNMEWDHRKQNNRFSGILLQEFCSESRTLIGPVKKIFKGTERGLVEGPHLYKRNGWYYLLTAEGGTVYAHAATLARSRAIDGPYELHPQKHLLSTYGCLEAELQKAGHASLVETHMGEWYLAHLCGRPIDGRHCTLGRETAIQKCIWGADDWLYLEQGGMIPSVTTKGPAGLPEAPFPEATWDGNFDSPELNLNFQSLRRPVSEDWLSLTERPGYLRLKGMEPTISSFRQSLLARRVQSFDISVETSVEFQPETFQQMAGLIAWYDTENHCYLRLSHDETLGRNLNIIVTDAAESCEVLLDDVPVPATGGIGMRLTLKGAALQFEFAIAGGDWRKIGPVLNGAILSDDYSHLGFTGAFVGMCCQDISGQKRQADFSRFVYRENS
ncbi:glycoside hydrolase family 43 protein [Luteolibacter arcticus]|uniref:Glycoside hydrolase family 43 protein n=1 Tax=Luteolibacter arcticus TaxID=1581411 RepID=A0ABT3GIU2_9BACT|nr:glycoside hydrolase family 43 protein [Luteolibacter arcticus]MCW1923417.1 glycoside hydrolase family 43 protein [Luteolibacter arcticus]